MGPATYAYVIKYTHIEEPNLGIQTQYGSISFNQVMKCNEES